MHSQKSAWWLGKARGDQMNDENWKEEFKRWKPALKPIQIKFTAPTSQKKKKDYSELMERKAKQKGLEIKLQLEMIKDFRNLEISDHISSG